MKKKSVCLHQESPSVPILNCDYILTDCNSALHMVSNCIRLFLSIAIVTSIFKEYIATFFGTLPLLTVDQHNSVKQALWEM